ncbi:hypothetical protein FACS1894203_4230 [Bacteroidia bacterium]|nr:hypothetical protein FACS1894203_4230 [Bacteroidia bacterium]
MYILLITTKTVLLRYTVKANLSKQEFMCVIEKTRRFIKNGFSVFSEASHGGCVRESNEVEEMRAEILGRKTGSFSADRMNLYNDRKNVSSDVRRAYNKLIVD